MRPFQSSILYISVSQMTIHRQGESLHQDIEDKRHKRHAITICWIWQTYFFSLWAYMYYMQCIKYTLLMYLVFLSSPCSGFLNFTCGAYIVYTYTWLIYRMSHRVPATFKLVYGHLNSIFLTWALSRHFANSGPKNFAKFQNFDPCTVCGKTLRDSGGVYLPAFWATPLYYLLFGPQLL